MLSVTPHASLEEFGGKTMTIETRCRTEQKGATRGELRHYMPLRHGGVAGFTLRYEMVGSVGAPLLLVAGGISAGRHVVASEEFPEAGWWQAQSASFGG